MLDRLRNVAVIAALLWAKGDAMINITSGPIVERIVTRLESMGVLSEYALGDAGLPFDFPDKLWVGSVPIPRVSTSVED